MIMKKTKTMKHFKKLIPLLLLGLCLSACGGDEDRGNANSSGGNNGGKDVRITESNIGDYVSCSITNSFTFANGNCKWNISASFKSILTNIISADIIRYGIAYGTLASIGEDFAERSMYSESTIAIMKKMGVDAFGEKYESGGVGTSFTISTSSTKSGSVVSSEEIDLLKSIKPYAVVVAFVEIGGTRYEIGRNTQSINIK